MSPLTYKNTSIESPVIRRSSTFKNRLFAFISILFISGVVAIGLFLIVDYFDYFDIQNFCYIRIEAVPKSEDKAAVKTVLKSLKEENPSQYVSLCDYVRFIMVEPCLLGEAASSDVNYLGVSGCYIKGSKTIYIRPGTSDDEKKEALIRYSSMCRDFWKGLPENDFL